MKIPLLMIFSFVMVISTWAKKALEDGKITADEGFDLLKQLAGLLGVPLILDVPPKVDEAIEAASIALDAASDIAGIN
ncbi:unnamed protein product, partial [marine sediment metagenome]